LAKQIVEYARTWIGVPFHHQGRSKAGCDCAGVIVACAKHINMNFSDMHGYGRLPKSNQLESIFRKQMISIPIESIQPADVVLMAWRSEPHHVGLISNLPNGQLGIIHSYQIVGKVVEHRLDKKWHDRIVLAFRFPQIVKGF